MPTSTPAAAAGLRVAIVGATGAVGRDLLATLPRSGLPVAEVRLLASPASSGLTLEYQERSHRVHVLADAPQSSPLFEGIDLAFLCTPPGVAAQVGPALAELGVMVVDLSGALADRAPVVFPGLGIETLPEASRARMAACPSGPAMLLTTVLAALRDLVPTAVRGTLLLSAGAGGRGGVEELSGQVVALLNHKDPPRKLFPTGLAFDLLPAVDDQGPLDEADPLAGWTPAERRIAAEVAVLTGLPPTRVILTASVAPLFTGLAASLHLQLDAEAPLSEIRARLEQGHGVVYSQPLPGPRRLVGRAGLYLGRLRADPAGDGVHLWAVADNLRFGGTANALGVATALWREGLV